MNNSICIYTELRRWAQDRKLQQRIPMRDSWRGCLGLGLLFDAQPEEYCHFGLRVLASNDLVRWICLRDIPAGQFPGSPVMDRRPVGYVSLTQAQLRFGVPVIDFSSPSREAWDFRFQPSGPFLHVGKHGRRLMHPGPDVLNPRHYLREFAVLNRLSAAMTRLASFGLDASGKPVCRSWYCRRPQGRPFRIAPSESFMPRPLLAFPRSEIEHLYDLVTHSAGSGTFIPLVFRERFCRAISGGLELHACEPMEYLGAGPASGLPHETLNADLKLCTHHFRSMLDGNTRMIHLPQDAHIYLRSGYRLEAGETWCQVLPTCPPRSWCEKPASQQWAILAGVCGGPQRLPFLEQLWFKDQGISLGECPNEVVFPGELVSPACGYLRPTALWWDLTPSVQHYQPASEGYALPPLCLHNWYDLRINFADVNLNASIGDPRFEQFATDHQQPAPTMLLAGVNPFDLREFINPNTDQCRSVAVAS